MSADEKLIAELARATFERQGHTGWDEAEPSLRIAWLDEARWELDWLAERGRLVPDGGLTRTEWAVTTPRGKQIHPVYDEAEARTCAIYGPRGVPVFRQVTTWPDGTTLTTPWVPVEPAPEETPDA